MLTTSHATWTWRAARGRPAAGWAILGGVAPDLPAIVRGAALAARGTPRERLLDAIYHGAGARRVHMTAHSLLTPAAIAVLAGRRSRAARMLALGWGGHIAVDCLTHHDDAWPPLWPLWRRRFAAPVSYWQAEHHARPWSAAETSALTLAALRDRGVARAAGLAVAALAAGPLLSPAGETVWSAAGVRPDAQARGRDLGEA